MAKQKRSRSEQARQPSPAIRWSTPRYSSKRRQKRITIEGTLLDDALKITLAGPPHVVQRVAHDLMRAGPATLFPLANALVVGVNLAARVAPRALARTGRKWFDEVTAAVYLYVQTRHRSDNIPAAMRRAEESCALRVPAWQGYSPGVKRWLLTAFLVHSAHRAEWKQRGFFDPLLAPEQIESFYVHHIRPGLAAVRASLAHPTARQLFSEGWDVRVRHVLEPWEHDEDGAAAIETFRRSYQPSDRPSRRA